MYSKLLVFDFGSWTNYFYTDWVYHDREGKILAIICNYPMVGDSHLGSKKALYQVGTRGRRSGMAHERL